MSRLTSSARKSFQAAVRLPVTTWCGRRTKLEWKGFGVLGGSCTSDPRALITRSENDYIKTLSTSAHIHHCADWLGLDYRLCIAENVQTVQRNEPGDRTRPAARIDPCGRYGD